MGVYRRGKNWYIDFYAQGRRVREKVGPKKKLTEKVLNKVKTEVIENRYLDIRRKPKVKFDTLMGLVSNSWPKALVGSISAKSIHT